MGFLEALLISTAASAALGVLGGAAIAYREQAFLEAENAELRARWLAERRAHVALKDAAAGRA